MYGVYGVYGVWCVACGVWCVVCRASCVVWLGMVGCGVVWRGVAWAWRGVVMVVVVVLVVLVVVFAEQRCHKRALRAHIIRFHIVHRAVILLTIGIDSLCSGVALTLSTRRSYRVWRSRRGAHDTAK